jgi:hypothetical protein
MRYAPLRSTRPYGSGEPQICSYLRTGRLSSHSSGVSPVDEVKRRSTSFAIWVAINLVSWAVLWLAVFPLGHALFKQSWF